MEPSCLNTYVYQARYRQSRSTHGVHTVSKPYDTISFNCPCNDANVCVFLHDIRNAYSPKQTNIRTNIRTTPSPSPVPRRNRKNVPPQSSFLPSERTNERTNAATIHPLTQGTYQERGDWDKGEGSAAITSQPHRGWQNAARPTNRSVG